MKWPEFKKLDKQYLLLRKYKNYKRKKAIWSIFKDIYRKEYTYKIQKKEVYRLQNYPRERELREKLREDISQYENLI